MSSRPPGSPFIQSRAFEIAAMTHALKSSKSALVPLCPWTPSSLTDHPFQGKRLPSAHSSLFLVTSDAELRVTTSSASLEGYVPKPSPRCPSNMSCPFHFLTILNTADTRRRGETEEGDPKDAWQEGEAEPRHHQDRNMEEEAASVPDRHL